MLQPGLVEGDTLGEFISCLCPCHFFLRACVCVRAGTLESELDVNQVHHLSPTEQQQQQQQQHSVGGGSARTGPGDSDQEREDDLAEVAEALG